MLLVCSKPSGLPSFLELNSIPWLQVPKRSGHWPTRIPVSFLIIFPFLTFFQVSFEGFIKHDKHLLPQCLHPCFLFIPDTNMYLELPSFKTLLSCLLFRETFPNHSVWNSIPITLLPYLTLSFSFTVFITTCH